MQTQANEFPFIYRHPGLTVFVDDSESYLASLELALPEHLAWIAYADPQQCLADVNAHHENHESLISRSVEFHRSHGTNALIHVSLDEIETEVSDGDRFRLPTVMVIDYEMPGMNGLELCRRLSNPCIGKILLTGEGDETLAVQAFNDGIIDRFIPKSDADAIGKVLEYCEALHNAYFVKLQNSILRSSERVAAHFGDATVLASIDALLRERGYVEHYISSNPLGYIILRADGSTHRLVLASRADLERWAALARSRNVPSEIVSKIESGSHVCNFYDNPEDYGADPYPWSEFMLPAKRVLGKQEWFVGIHEDNPQEIDFNANEHSFLGFLQSLEGGHFTPLGKSGNPD